MPLASNSNVPASGPSTSCQSRLSPTLVLRLLWLLLALATIGTAVWYYPRPEASRRPAVANPQARRRLPSRPCRRATCRLP